MEHKKITIGIIKTSYLKNMKQTGELQDALEKFNMVII